MVILQLKALSCPAKGRGKGRTYMFSFLGRKFGKLLDWFKLTLGYVSYSIHDQHN
jgi:hypothetical protein